MKKAPFIYMKSDEHLFEFPFILGGIDVYIWVGLYMKSDKHLFDFPFILGGIDVYMGGFIYDEQRASFW